MDYENVLGEHKFPTYEELKSGLLRLIDEGKISREDAARLLPELHESEDERIRKAIVGLMAVASGAYLIEATGFKKEQFLSYLEKQKEQKPNYCHHEVDETGWTEEYRKAYYDGWNNCNMQHEQIKADQKPVEWSEEDKNMWTHLNGYLNGFSCSEDAIKQMADWFYELPNRFNLQPKQEWSEQEWSEEDEVYLQDALWCVKQASKVARGENDMGACWSAERWLKSLRPSWKPSEELLDALYIVANLPELEFYGGIKDKIRELYKLLKKL